MSKCIECGKEALPGSNLCGTHQLDGRDILYIKQDIDTEGSGGENV
jgi:hypothetical protein